MYKCMQSITHEQNVSYYGCQKCRLDTRQFAVVTCYFAVHSTLIEDIPRGFNFSRVIPSMPCFIISGSTAANQGHCR